VMVAVNAVLVLAYMSNNRNQLIYSPIAKAGLPFYRSAREVINAAIDSTYVFAMRRDVGIPQYRLEIATDDLRKLNNALPSSLDNEVIAGSILFDEALKDTVKGVLHYGDKAYDVKVRYRGLNPNHWTRPKKSWQIKFNKDTPFQGIRTLKLIIPVDRGYFAEALNNYRAKKLGLSYPAAEFVQLYVNNNYQGVYFSVEDFSAAFLERSQLPPDANIYATDEPLSTDQEDAIAYDSVSFWNKQTSDTLFNFDNFSELDFLLSRMQQDNFADVAPDIIDMDNFYSWNIVALLAGSNHQSDWGNMRLYFNNVKGKFEFIPWDVGLKNTMPDQLANELTEKLLSNPTFYQERNRRLWEYVSNEKNLQDDVTYYDGLYNQLKGAFYSDFKKHENNHTFNGRVVEIRNQYAGLFGTLKGLFGEDIINLTVRHDASKKILALSFEVDSFAGVTLAGITLPQGSQLVSNTGQYLFRPNEDVAITYSGVPIGDISSIIFNLIHAVTGEPVGIGSIRFIDNSTFAKFDDVRASAESFVAAHAQFRLENNEIILPSGIHVFLEDIVAPKDVLVSIQPGTTIYFAPGVSFVSYSPIEALGTAGRPIVLRRLNPNEPWGSFAILNAGSNKSTIEYLDADGGGSDYINGSFISGMVSVYYSDIEARNLTISRSASDDGMNLKYSKVLVMQSTFNNNSADGLDGDYISGTIDGSVFLDNGNDGIDLSGSRIMISNNRLAGSGDKCVSIGEGTNNTVIFNTILDGCHIGVQAKDGSYPAVINSIIINNDIGIDTYRKKELYITGGHIVVSNSIIRGNAEAVHQDEFSDIAVSFSNIQGAYSGEGNFDEDKNYFLVQDIGKGDTHTVIQYAGINVEQAPVGLFEAF